LTESAVLCGLYVRKAALRDVEVLLTIVDGRAEDKDGLVQVKALTELVDWAWEAHS